MARLDRAIQCAKRQQKSDKFSAEQGIDIGLRATMRPSLPTVKFDKTRVTEAVRVEVRSCIERIEGLGNSQRQHLYGPALQCVLDGGNSHVLYEALNEFARATLSKAEMREIAVHVWNRANSVMDRERKASIGIEFATWLYSGAPCLPFVKHPTQDFVNQDAAHKAVDGKRFRVSDGLFLNGKQTWPGWERGCKCTSKPILPGFD
jgi:hypothetical protein